LRKPGLEWKGI